VTQIGIQFGEKLRILEITLVGLAQRLHRAHQRFGDENTAEGSKMTGFVGKAADNAAFNRFVQQSRHDLPLL